MKRSHRESSEHSQEFLDAVRRRILKAETSERTPSPPVADPPVQQKVLRVSGNVNRRALQLSRIPLATTLAACCLVLIGLAAFALARSPAMESPPAPTSDSGGDSRERIVAREIVAPEFDEAPSVASSPTNAAVPAAPLALKWFGESPANLQANWPNNPNGMASFSNGEYRVRTREPGRFVAIAAPINAPLQDVAVQARFRKVGGPSGGGYGIIVRDLDPGQRDGVNQEGSYYVLEAGDRGEYGIWRREGNRWIDLIPWTPAPSVRPGGVSNELTVIAVRERLRLAINGSMVAEVSDATLSEGGIGIFVGGDLNEVVVEHFAVEAPPLELPL
jgi:hypothetical protein